MTAISVVDIDLPNVQARRYELAIFSSGYEARCTHAPRALESCEIGEALVLGFTQLAESEQRKRNDEYFLSKWKKTPVLMSTDDDQLIFERLNRALGGRSGLTRLLVD